MAQAALITGGAKRIGRAIALALAEDGYDIAVHYNHSAAEAGQVVAEIRALGRRAEAFACDLADRQQVPSLADAVFAAFADCRVLVNNASIFRRVPLADTDDREFDENFDVHVRAPLRLCQEFARRCTGEGQIINLTDACILGARTAYFAYTLSKKTLHEFTRMAARALAPRFRVNSVCPGLILPPDGQDEAWLNRMAAALPLRRHGSVQDIVRAVRFLLASNFITGQAIFVDGGENL